MTPAVGDRFELQSNTGTLRYIGPVQGTKGSWLGVEWDDPQRGKHSGERQGHQYFTCRIDHAGSFIRDTPAIVWGVSFLEALKNKYIDTFTSTGVESYVLGSSAGAIEVEAPRLDRVRNKFSHIDRLREISLDGLTVSSAPAEDTAQVSQLCQNIQGLNLSKNLISRWSTVNAIISNLHHLRTLNLNRNRFVQLENLLEEVSTTLRELYLNYSLILWTELPFIGSAFPALTTLQLGFNNFTRLDKLGDSLSRGLANLTSLYLDGNHLRSWTNIVEVVATLPKLEYLALSETGLEMIPGRAPELPCLRVRHLGLSGNALSSWTSIDALAEWCPRLEELSMGDNPLTESNASPYAREFLTAKIPSLTSLDGAQISRQDAELFYLGHITQTTDNEDQRVREHPQWLALCQKHGRPSEVKQTGPDTLGNRLMKITLYEFTAVPASPSVSAEVPEHSSAVALRVLPTMTVKTLRLKASKVLKIRGVRAGGVRLWGVLAGTEGTGWVVRELDTDDERRLDWWGLEEGSGVGVYVAGG